MGNVTSLGADEIENITYTNGLRVTKDHEGTILDKRSIKKTRLNNTDIFNHGNDFRVSISNEKCKLFCHNLT